MQRRVFKQSAKGNSIRYYCYLRGCDQPETKLRMCAKHYNLLVKYQEQP